jgi:hypothetical protein
LTQQAVVHPDWRSRGTTSRAKSQRGRCSTSSQISGLEFRCLGDFFVHLTEISSLTHLNDFWDEVQLLVSGLIHLQGFEILL